MVKQGITVVTWKEGSPQTYNLLKSMIGTPYPIFIEVNGTPHGYGASIQVPIELLDNPTPIKIHASEIDGFELGAIRSTLDNTDWDEFIVLQDTFEIKNIDVFRKLFEDYPGRSVSYNPHFQMYFGKYRREVLEKMSIPVIDNKIEAVRQEGLFHATYRGIEVPAVFNEQFVDGNFYGSWEEKWGRKNLLMQDDYVIKRKGTWRADQL